MKFNRNQFLLLTGLFVLSSSANVQCMEASAAWVADYCTQRNLIVAGCCAAAGYAGYQFYQYSKEYVENRIVEETIQAIEVGLTPVSALDVLSSQDREAALRKKAQLINMRKRVMAALTTQIDTLSNQHKEIIQKDLVRAKKAFSIIDLFRKHNPYEKEYTIATSFDSLVENNIVSSIILTTKPDNECTQKELVEKQKKAERKAKILAKLAGRINALILAQLMQSTFLFNMIAG